MTRFDANFDAIKQAMQPASGQLVTAHMLEWTQAFSVRSDEIDQLASVMANRAGAAYDDYHADGLNSRHVRSHAQGFVGLSTTALRADQRIRLFPSPGHRTGILLVNPTPVMVSRADAYTEYDQRKPDARILLRIAKLRNVTDTDYALFKAHGISMDERQITIDPLDPQAHARARAALELMWQQSRPVEGKTQPIAHYNETVVNAALSQVKAVIACEKEFRAFDLSAPGWAQRLAANPTLAPLLKEAIIEQKQWAEHMRAEGLPPPTIVLYQIRGQSPEDMLVHFPPTERNIALVENALAKAAVERIAITRGDGRAR